MRTRIRIPGPDHQATPDEEPLRRVLDPILDLSKAILTDESAYGVLLSRTSRELRRHYGTEGAATIFAAVAAQHTGEAFDEIRTEVPPDSYREGADAQHLWDLLGHFIAQGYHRHGDLVFTVLLASASKRLQERLGRGGAGVVFQQFADTQHEAAKFDL